MCRTSFRRAALIVALLTGAAVAPSAYAGSGNICAASAASLRSNTLRVTIVSAPAHVTRGTRSVVKVRVERAIETLGSVDNADVFVTLRTGNTSSSSWASTGEEGVALVRLGVPSRLHGGRGSLSAVAEHQVVQTHEHCSPKLVETGSSTTRATTVH
jgi:hypothetical protein